MKIDYKKIRNIDWYRQGAAIKPLYASYPIIGCSVFFIKNTLAPIFYKNIIVDINNGHMIDYMDKAILKKIVYYYSTQQLKNHNFINGIKTHWEKYNVQPFFQNIEKINQCELKNLGNKELLNEFLNFSDKYMLVWKNSIFHDAFDVFGEFVLTETLNKKKCELSGKEIQILLANTKPSILQKERLATLEIAEIIVKNKKIKDRLIKLNIIQIKKEFPNIYKKISSLVDKFHWVHNDFHTIIKLDEKYFWGNIKKLINDKKLIAEERCIKKELKDNKISQNKLIKDKNISKEIISVVNMLTIIANWRDERKAYMQIASSVINRFIKKFSLRTGIYKNLLEYCLHTEIKNIFTFNKNNMKELSKREELGMLGIIYNRNKIDWFNIKEAAKIRLLMKKIFAEKTELKGSAAFPGKVIAKAKIILGRKDFYKLKRGEILIAPNTRPEYVPIIKIAGAIISEEGGITCHTAIVSRELKKPAIIGVQGIINIIKDGDTVEVDTDKGIVRKLK